MTVKELVHELNNVYNELDNLGDERLSTVVRTVEKLTEKVGDIVSSLEDDGITSKEKEEETKEG